MVANASSSIVDKRKEQQLPDCLHYEFSENVHSIRHTDNTSAVLYSDL